MNQAWRSFSFMHCLALGTLLMMVTPFTKADELALKVTGSFINVHSGPADEFPIFYVLAQGDAFTITKQRTGWYKVVANRNGQALTQNQLDGPSTGRMVEGWIKAQTLDGARLSDGTSIAVSEGTFDEFVSRTWELSAFAGAIDKVTSLSVGGAWVWTKNLAVELTYSQALGNFADNKIWSIRMRQTFFADWKVSPYLAVGTGEINTKPRANLVQSGDEIRKSSHYEVGIGAQYYFASAVVLRAEYRSLLALTDRDEQERLDQWMLGVTVFF